MLRGKTVSVMTTNRKKMEIWCQIYLSISHIDGLSVMEIKAYYKEVKQLLLVVEREL